MPILSVENVSVSYGKVKAVSGVSLIGPNCAGTTTLMHASMGLRLRRGSRLSSKSRSQTLARYFHSIAFARGLTNTTLASFYLIVQSKRDFSCERLRGWV